MSDVDLNEFLSVIFDGVNLSEQTVCLADVRPGPDGTRDIFPARAWKPGRSRIQGATYFAISTVRPANAQKKLQRTLADCMRTYVIVLDDIGTKVKPEVFADKPAPHYVLETSPGNFQWGYIIHNADPLDAAALIHALAEAGYTDKGAQGQNRVVRVPGSVNTKHGQRFVATIVEWFPDDPLFTVGELAAAFGVTPVEGGVLSSSTGRSGWKGAETNDPVFNYLQSEGMVLGPPNSDGYASIQCPWSAEHTDPREDARWAVGEGLTGAFHCFHGACEHRGTATLLAWIAEHQGPDFHRQQGERVASIGQKLMAHAVPRAGARGRSPERPPVRPETRQGDPAGLGEPRRAPAAVAALLAEILDRMPAILRSQLPTIERTAGGGVKAEQKPVTENVGFVAANTGFSVRKNELTGEVEIDHDDDAFDQYSAPADRQRLVRELLVSASQRVGISVRAMLQGIVEALASGHGYHPTIDWVLSVKWDNVDRVQQLCDTLDVADTKWRDTAVRSWLMQCVVAWTNWQRAEPVAVPYVLTLVGGQGIGKTSWFRSLLPRGGVQTEASLHLDSMRADDQKRRVLSSAIVELGELDSTFGKSEIGALKAFLSSTSDRYRLPYDRDVTNRIRCTSFGASVNEFEFLLDTTGARRFWPMHVTGCNWKHGIDLQQLWAQVHTMVMAGENWNLDDVQVKQHERAVEQHQHVTYAESLLGELDARERSIPTDEWTFASAAEVGKYYRLEGNTNNWRAVGRKLRALLGDPSASNGKKGWRVPIRKHEFTSGYVAFTAAVVKLKVVK